MSPTGPQAPNVMLQEPQQQQPPPQHNQKATPGHRILPRSDYKTLPSHVQKAITGNSKPVEFIKEISNHVTGVVVCYRIKFEDNPKCQLIAHQLLKLPKTRQITDFSTLPPCIKGQLDYNTISVSEVSSHDEKFLYYRVTSQQTLTKNFILKIHWFVRLLIYNYNSYLILTV